MNELELLISNERPFVIYDTEYTAWEGSMARGWSAPGEHRELIQIGALLLEGRRDLEILGAMDVLVKPSINDRLSSYVQELTGISQADIDERGVHPADALGYLSEFGAGLTHWSYGRDFEILDENCDLNSLPRLSNMVRFDDIKGLISSLGVDVEKHSSGTLHQAVGRSLDGQVHNALFDCLSIRECLLAFMEQ